MGFNLLFAGLDALDPHGLAFPHDEAQIPTFWREFFVSVHIVATIGYARSHDVEDL